MVQNARIQAKIEEMRQDFEHIYFQNYCLPITATS